MPKIDGVYNYTKETGQSLKKALAEASVGLILPPTDLYIALEFHMTHHYMSHGDLGNAIRMAEQAKADMLSKGIAVDDPKMLPFYALLETVYNFRHIRVADLDSEQPYLAEYSRIAVGYNALIAKLGGLENMPADPVMPYTIIVQFDERSIADKAAEQKKEEKLDLTATARKPKKREQVEAYFNMGLEFVKDLKLDPEQQKQEDLRIASIHLQIARMFLGQPDHRNAVIHAERAKAILSRFYNEKDEAMLKCYRFLLETYSIQPEPKANADQSTLDKYAEAADYYANLIIEIDKAAAPKPRF